MRAQRGIHFASGWLTITYNFGDGFLDQKTREPLMTSSGTVESLKYFIELMKCAPPDVAAPTLTRKLSQPSWQVELRCGSTLQLSSPGSWTQPSPRSTTRLALFRHPQVQSAMQAYSQAGTWLSPLAQRIRDAAWAFITYMTSRAKAKEYVLHGGSTYQNIRIPGSGIGC